MRTLEQQIEYDKCCKDFKYFINKYTQIEKYSPLLADFKLYPFQEKLLSTIDSEDLVLINTARQMGITTVMMAYILWKINFTPKYKATHINVNAVQGITSLDLLRQSYDLLPDYLKTPCLLNNKRKLTLSNESSISIMSAMTPSLSYDLVFIDNASFVKGIRELYAASRQQVTSNGKLIITSTLYKSGWFVEMCKEAELNNTPFSYVKLPYYLHPRRDRLWRSNTEASIGEVGAIVECDCTHYYSEEIKLVPLVE